MKSLLIGCTLSLLMAFPVSVLADDVVVGKEFQGKWNITSIKTADDELDGEIVRSFNCKIDGADMVWNVNNNVRKAKIAQLGTEGTAKPIDIRATSGDEEGTVFEGIYDLQGDTLRICLNIVTSIKQRPAEFDVPQGSSFVILTLKKEAQ